MKNMVLDFVFLLWLSYFYDYKIAAIWNLITKKSYQTPHTEKEELFFFLNFEMIYASWILNSVFY